MTSTIRIHNGPNTVDVTEAELALLFESPKDRWGNLEIAVEHGHSYAAVHWSGFTARQTPVGSGFLVRHQGESPLGDQESPEILSLLDGGSEPFPATARHLLDDRDACWLVWQLGRSGGRPTHWPDGRPLVWSNATVDETPWRALGTLGEPYFESLISLLYGDVTLDDAGEDQEDQDAYGDEDPAIRLVPRGESRWIHQKSLRLEASALTDREAEALPRSAIWPVLRHLHDVADPRWLALLAHHPMPWLRSLILVLDDLDDLAGAVRQLPRLVEMGVYSQPEVLPAIEATLLEELLLEGPNGELIDGFLRGSRLPALRVLALHGDALTAPIDFSPLRAGAIVHVVLVGRGTSARSLALELKPEHSADALVRGLATRADRDTWISTSWIQAREAIELARAREIHLRAR